jgi:hypothetical protein
VVRRPNSFARPLNFKETPIVTIKQEGTTEAMIGSANKMIDSMINSNSFLVTGCFLGEK